MHIHILDIHIEKEIQTYRQRHTVTEVSWVRKSASSVYTMNQNTPSFKTIDCNGNYKNTYRNHIRHRINLVLLNRLL